VVDVTIATTHAYNGEFDNVRVLLGRTPLGQSQVLISRCAYSLYVIAISMLTNATDPPNFCMYLRGSR
jgi:hypothetical protein